MRLTFRRHRPASKARSNPIPWIAKDAKAKTHKADTPKKSRQWADVADSVLAKTGNEGRAVREANAVVAHASRPISHWSKK